MGWGYYYRYSPQMVEFGPQHIHVKDNYSNYTDGLGASNCTTLNENCVWFCINCIDMILWCFMFKWVCWYIRNFVIIVMLCWHILILILIFFFCKWQKSTFRPKRNRTKKRGGWMASRVIPLPMWIPKQIGHLTLIWNLILWRMHGSIGEIMESKWVLV